VSFNIEVKAGYVIDISEPGELIDQARVKAIPQVIEHE
jgi:hypothetical protein